VYCSDQAHSSVVKAAMIAGLGTASVRKIAVDAALAMDPAALTTAMAADAAAGIHPALVVATVGTTSTGAMDPVRPIVGASARHGAWVHIDAAWAGSAAVCPEHRGMLDGVEGVDSFSFNPHKWLLTNFDCAAFWTADRLALTDALSITPEYLRNAASDAGAVIDYRDWQIPLGRRFRALKLWFVIRHYGAQGLRAHIREHIRIAEVLKGAVRADPRFEMPVPRSLSLVCLRLTAGDDATKRLLARVNESGKAFLSHTVVPIGGTPTYLIRIAIGATRTEERHVLALWDLLRSLAD
jgi:aromatic-L-amino-acid decarboxylase